MINRRTLIVTVASLGITGFLVSTFVVPEEDQAGDDAALAADVPLIRPYSPILGPEDAPVTIVEFFDPACEACRAFHPTVKQILSDHEGQVRVVMRYANFHPQSEEAIRILESARIQGVFEPVLELLLRTQPNWAPHGQSGISAWAVLNGTGVDIRKAKNDALMPDITAIINQDTADIKAIGVNQTPTFFVNRKRLTEFGPQQLKDLVAAEVSAL